MTNCLDKKDTLFKEKRATVTPFSFDAAVASVFDDMIRRSVPGYEEVIARESQLAAAHYIPGTHIYDLGCSNGNLEAAMAREPALRDAVIVSVDNAPAMLQSLVKRVLKDPAMRIYPLCMDIGDVPIRNASVVVINYTLQFIPPSVREDLLADIFEGMVPGGILLMAEKTDHANPDMSRLQQDFYYRFKKENGYSELEISQKREALENVLLPETVAAHLERLRRIGFGPVDLWFQWFNFAAFIARKG